MGTNTIKVPAGVAVLLLGLGLMLSGCAPNALDGAAGTDETAIEKIPNANGREFDVRKNYVCSPFCLAAEKGDQELGKFLADKDPEVNLKDERGRSPTPPIKPEQTTELPKIRKNSKKEARNYGGAIMTLMVTSAVPAFYPKFWGWSLLLVGVPVAAIMPTQAPPAHRWLTIAAIAGLGLYNIGQQDRLDESEKLGTRSEVRRKIAITNFAVFTAMWLITRPNDNINSSNYDAREAPSTLPIVGVEPGKITLGFLHAF